MGSITAERIIEQARYTLNDISDEVRWTDGELLRYLSDGQRLAVKLDHMANPVTESFDLALDPSSKQDLPAHAYALIAAIRIMDGDTVQKMNYVVATRNIPGWHEATVDETAPVTWADATAPTTRRPLLQGRRHPRRPAPTTTSRTRNAMHTSATGNVRTAAPSEDAATRWDDYPLVYELKKLSNYTHYLYEPKADRRTFYVYPHPAATGTDIEIVISKIPAELDDISDTIELDDVYEPALVSYVLHRGFAKDIAAQGQEHAKVQFYYQQFMAGLGMSGG